MTTTLAQLLQPQTAEQVFAVLLGVYQANGFPVQSWQEGGTERTRLMAIATAIADLSANYIPGITAGGFVDLAPGTGWMPLLASEMYELDQNQANFTVGTIRATANATSGPYTVAAGKLIAVFGDTGNRYINSNSGTIPNNGHFDFTFKSEFAAAKYNDPSNSGSITLVNPLPGVTLTNPASTFSSVAHVGAGTGTITPTGSPSIPHLVTVTIDEAGSGDSGAASWSYSVDGSAVVEVGAHASGSIGSTGITVTLVDGSASPSFIAGDEYTFQTPGSWISSPGSDLETDDALSARCKARWSSISNIGTTQLYQLLATSTPSVGSQVTQVIVVNDANINNKLDIVIAGPAGALPVGVVSAVQTFVNDRVPITVFPNVTTPSTTVVDITATVTCSAALFTTVKTAVTKAINDYLFGLPINGVIRISSIIEKVMEVQGVIDCTDVTIDGGTNNVRMGSVGSYILPDSTSTITIAWVTQ